MATKKVNPIPKGYHTVTPHIVVRDAAKAIDFYKRAFGAEEVMRLPGPDGHGIMHAELKIGDSFIMLGEESPEMGGECHSPESLGGSAVTLNLYVKDVDAAFERAVSAGAQVKMPLADMFWGDRYGALVDPFGHKWSLATHIEDVSPEEIRKRAEAFFAEAAK
ncbi:MAG: VOC family protein [Candidatus Abyssobacteria bacterium SURF_17]|jgi:uncharacterized glyoxalase superfamily protein PhnB|uniref:VOC family protein n=1 Tax=Candidatus Abyssobacteria bacterium SURF_17 TaxID=2093361 RepID=A0A419F2U8_9BACT|nr:MAG: VOC family protein [Candidatus Abyssubacteria bacterium SURF_17]